MLSPPFKWFQSEVSQHVCDTARSAVFVVLLDVGVAASLYRYDVDSVQLNDSANLL